MNLRYFILTFLLASSFFYSVETKANTVITFSSYDKNISLKVDYFPHNKPTIDSYIRGKEKISSLITKFKNKRIFLPKFESLKIGIAPNKMNSEDIIFKEGIIYLNVSAKEELLERKLLTFFEFDNSLSEVDFHFFYEPTVEEFLAGKQKFEATVQKFKESNLGFKLPQNSKVYISAIEMTGGLFVSYENLFFVTFSISEEQLEKELIYLVKEE